MTSPRIPDRVPAGATPEGDGIIVGAGPVRVDIFIDFQCPFCRRFELAAGPTLAGLVADQLASLVYHPMNFLDGPRPRTTRLVRPRHRAALPTKAGSLSTRMNSSSISRPRAGQG